MQSLTGAAKQAESTSYETRVRRRIEINHALELHERHKGTFCDGCMICMFDAVRIVENGSKAFEQAQAFISRSNRHELLTALNEIRTQLGNDAPAWMFKVGYMA